MSAIIGDNGKSIEEPKNLFIKFIIESKNCGI